MRALIRYALIALALLCGSYSPGTLAHKPSDSYLTLRVNGSMLQGQWDIALRDLEYAIGLDANGDGEITWGELKARHLDIANYALARLELRSGGGTCAPRITGQQVQNHSDGAYSVLQFEADCPRAIETLELSYSLFFDLDAQHKGLLRLENGAMSRTAIFAVENAAQRLVLAESSAFEQFANFVKEGVWHIWIGFDHILFILSLLLPSVLIYRDSRWQPALEARLMGWDVLKVVTSFTLAHSITLSLAALEIIALPSRFVEAAIAFSVVLAALNNIWPVVLGKRWAVAFLFGLIHGFGFATVLADLGLPQGALVLALVGFNVGVELGQLAIVGVFLPLAYAMRTSRFYYRILMLGGSSVIAILALLWFIERAFDVKML